MIKWQLRVILCHLGAAIASGKALKLNIFHYAINRINIRSVDIRFCITADISSEFKSIPPHPNIS